MKTITTSQLRDILANLRGATPIAFTAMTEARLRPRALLQEWGSELIAAIPPVPARFPHYVECPFQDGLKKLSRVQAFTGNGWGYTTAVHRQQLREGQSPTFKAEERSWGEQISAALVRKGSGAKAAFYLSAQLVGRNRSPIYFAKDSKGLLHHVARHLVEPFLERDDSAAKQQLAKPVLRRDYRLDHIRSLTLNGESYRMVP